MKNLNKRWKKIIICAIVGAAVGLFDFIVIGSPMNLFAKILVVVLVMPLGVNVLYWGWIATWGFLRKKEIFLVMSIGKWIAFFAITFFLSYLVGFVAFPVSVYKAIKNQE